MMTNTTAMAPAMALALSANFGSVALWGEQVAALHKAHGAEPGQLLLLLFRPAEGTLAHVWAADERSAPAGTLLILALEPGADPDTGHRPIDWSAAYERYQHAVHAASESAGTDADGLQGALLLDVRRAGVFEQAGTTIPGARWRDPASVGQWSADLPNGREIVVYCVYGHEVGRATALRLRALGLQARYLRGGIDGWQAAGRAVAPKEAAS